MLILKFIGWVLSVFLILVIIFFATIGLCIFIDSYKHYKDNNRKNS